MTLHADVADLQTFAKEAESSYNEIEGLVKKIWAGKMQTTETWKGGAQVAFDQLMDSYAARAEKLNDKLLETSQKLMEATNSYSEQDALFKGQVDAKMAELDLPAI
ncbi:WXG100 family type VII secretion target [Nocardia neocaledoniensis]|uniref:WXG100 family type VII secretion target n=1 Tax=Nocardia neocaledoniensis TaxID=236511 RepID=UPI00245820F6|nr:WXG100 family type VII secretion target [Nocardia neocaledoniensis]